MLPYLQLGPYKIAPFKYEPGSMNTRTQPHVTNLSHAAAYYAPFVNTTPVGVAGGYKVSGNVRGRVEFSVRQELSIHGRIYQFNWPSSEHAYHAQKLIHLKQSLLDNHPAQKTLTAMLTEIQQFHQKFLPKVYNKPTALNSFEGLVNRHLPALKASGQPFANMTAYENFKPFYSEQNRDFMKETLRLKFKTHPVLMERAIDCALNGVFPVEVSRHDPHWASGPDGDGRNSLGILILEVANEELLFNRHFQGQLAFPDPEGFYTTSLQPTLNTRLAHDNLEPKIRPKIGPNGKLLNEEAWVSPRPVDFQVYEQFMVNEGQKAAIEACIEMDKHLNKLGLPATNWRHVSPTAPQAVKEAHARLWEVLKTQIWFNPIEVALNQPTADESRALCKRLDVARHESGMPPFNWRGNVQLWNLLKEDPWFNPPSSWMDLVKAKGMPTLTSDHLVVPYKVKFGNPAEALEYGHATWNLMDQGTNKNVKRAYSNNPEQVNESNAAYQERKTLQIQQIMEQLKPVKGLFNRLFGRAKSGEMDFLSLQEIDFLWKRGEPYEGLKAAFEAALKERGYDYIISREGTKRQAIVYNTNDFTLIPNSQKTHLPEKAKGLREPRDTVYTARFQHKASKQAVCVGSMHLDFDQDYGHSLNELNYRLAQEKGIAGVSITGDANHAPNKAIHGLGGDYSRGTHYSDTVQAGQYRTITFDGIAVCPGKDKQCVYSDLPGEKLSCSQDGKRVSLEPYVPNQKFAKHASFTGLPWVKRQTIVLDILGYRQKIRQLFAQGHDKIQEASTLAEILKDILYVSVSLTPAVRDKMTEAKDIKALKTIIGSAKIQLPPAVSQAIQLIDEAEGMLKDEKALEKQYQAYMNATMVAHQQAQHGQEPQSAASPVSSSSSSAPAPIVVSFSAHSDPTTDDFFIKPSSVEELFGDTSDSRKKSAKYQADVWTEEQRTQFVLDNLGFRQQIGEKFQEIASSLDVINSSVRIQLQNLCEVVHQSLNDTNNLYDFKELIDDLYQDSDWGAINDLGLWELCEQAMNFVKHERELKQALNRSHGNPAVLQQQAPISAKKYEKSAENPPAYNPNYSFYPQSSSSHSAHASDKKADEQNSGQQPQGGKKT